MVQRSKRLYPLKVTVSDLHLIHYMLLALLETRDKADFQRQIAFHAENARKLIGRAEMESLLRRVEECLYKVVPAYRQMGIYDMMLPQMEIGLVGEGEERPRRH